MTRSAAMSALALALLALVLTAGPASAEPGRSGGGPLTTVTGWYQLEDETGTSSWAYAPPEADHSFTLSSGLVRVAMGGTCVQPDTRELRTASLVGEEECTTPAPEVQPWWAR